MSFRVQNRKPGKDAYQERVGQKQKSTQKTLADVKKAKSKKVTVPVGQPAPQQMPQSVPTEVVKPETAILNFQENNPGREAYQSRVGQLPMEEQKTLADLIGNREKLASQMRQAQQLQQAQAREYINWALDGNITNQGDLEALRKEIETYASRSQRRAFGKLEHAFAKAERQAQEAINSALINPNSSNSQINKILKSAKSLPELEALYQQAENAGKLSNEGILKSFEYHFDRIKERAARLQGSEAGKTVLAMESATDLNELDNLRKTAIENGTWNNEAKNAYEQQLKKQGINPSKQVKEMKQVASEVAQVPQAPHVPQVEPQMPKIESPIQQAPHVPQVEPQVPKIESPIQQAPKPYVPKAGENVVSEEVQAATKNAKKFGKGKIGLMVGGALALGAAIFGLAKSCESKDSTVLPKPNTQKPEVQKPEPQKQEPQKQETPKVAQDSTILDKNDQANLANINGGQENAPAISNDSTVTISKDRPRQAYDQAFYEVAGFKYTNKNDPKVKAILADNSKNIQIIKRMHELMSLNIEQMPVDTIESANGTRYIQHTRVGQELKI